MLRFFLQQQYHLWNNNAKPLLLNEHGVAPSLGLEESSDQRIARSSISLEIIGGVGGLGSARGGGHCCARITKRKYAVAKALIFPELLLGIYTLPWSCRTLQTVGLAAQVRLPTNY